MPERSFEYKDWHNYVVIWSFLISSISFIGGVLFGVGDFYDTLNVAIGLSCIIFCMIIAYMITYVPFTKGLLEERKITVYQNRIVLDTHLSETIPIECIEKIIIDSKNEIIGIYLKNRKKIVLPKKYGNLFDMQRDTPESEYRLAGLLKALKEVGVKYEIIYRE